MAAAVGVTVVKRFTYRGDANEEYANTYWLTGDAPANAAAWRTLFDQLVTAEKPLYPSSVSVVRGYGYDDDTGHKSGDTGAVSPAVWSVDLNVSPDTPVAGTFSPGGSDRIMAGDAAVWVRWKIARRNEDGKPIFLRKFFHPAYGAASPADATSSLWLTAAGTYGAKFHDGTSFGARTLTAPGHSDTIESHGASSYVTTRTLKRRGKRPPA